MGWFQSFFKKETNATIAANCFNEYQKWFSKLQPTSAGVDLKLTIRIRAFGSEAEKQAAWDRDWRSKHPGWGPVAAGCNVSSNPPEVWMDLRQANGKLILPPHILGHEIMHSVNVAVENAINPDRLIDDEAYNEE